MSDIIYQLPPVIRGPTLQSLSNEEHVGYQNRSWFLHKVHSYGIDGSEVIHGVGDTGVSKIHIEKELSNVIRYDSFVDQYAGWDRNGHGSHCLSIIAAKGHNEYGLIGAAPKSKGVSAKVLSDGGSGSDKAIANGIKWMMDQGAIVISLSLGSPNKSSLITKAIEEASDNGCIVFAASGNDGRNNNVDYPAAGPNCIPVGAVDWKLRLANFSDRGRQMQDRGVVGAGVDVYGCVSRGFARMSGTSMATPFVAGLCVLAIDAEIKILGERKTLYYTDFIDLVKKYHVDLGPEGSDTAYGLGAFDVCAYVEDLKKKHNDPVTKPEDPVESEPVGKIVASFEDEGRQYQIRRIK